MFEAVKKSITGFGNFSEEQLTEIISRLKPLQIAKDCFLMNKGKICRQFYFVNHGAFRQYSLLENEQELTSNLFLENDWLFDYKSFMTQTPSETSIQATEDSEVVELGADHFHELIKLSDAFFRIGRIFEIALQNQDYQNTRISPEEKYALLMSNKPQIIQKFPLKYIASYLNITPETLSRVRRKIIP